MEIEIKFDSLSASSKALLMKDQNNKKEVTEQDVVKIAHLSKLALQGDELKNLTNDFNQILDFVGQIEQADVQDDITFDNPLDIKNVRRADSPHESISIHDVRNLTSNFESGFFVVPKVIES